MLLITKLKDRLLFRKSPVQYWRSKGAKIGNGTEIFHTARLGSEPYLVEIGDHVRIGSDVSITTHDGAIWVLRNLYEEYKEADIMRPVKIGNNVHIGTGVIVMPGVTIGNNCVVGCGAVVTKDIPDNSVAVGVPARVVKTIEQYAEKNKESFIYTKGMPANQKRKYLLNHFNKGNDQP